MAHRDCRDAYPENIEGDSFDPAIDPSHRDRGSFLQTVNPHVFEPTSLFRDARPLILDDARTTPVVALPQPVTKEVNLQLVTPHR